MDKTIRSSKRTNTDVLQATIGDFGKWQCRISICMALLKFPIAWFQLGIVFLAPPTEYWCRQPQDFKGMTLPEWIDTIAPFGNESNYNAATSRCVMRNLELPTESKLVSCKWGYEYNRTVIQSSIITDWDLICGKERLVDIAQMTLMLGVLLGNIMFGIIADKYGRKKTLIVCILLQSVCGMLSAWAPLFSVFLLFRFIMAIANGGTMITSFVMCMEVVGGAYRSIVPILYQIPFGIGNTIMAGLAYNFRSWRELQVALSILSGFYLLYIWVIPESPRWLLATGRKKEAAKVMESAAITNGLDIKEVKKAFLSLPIVKRTEQAKFSSVLSTPQLRKRTFLLSINWLFCGITFYGFSQYLGQVGTNLYFTVSVGGLIAIPGTFLCVFVVKRFGRRWTIACSYFFTAACFFAILTIPIGVFTHDWPRIAFAGLGIIGLSISTPALYLFTGELFPTVLRNAGVGGTMMFSRIGSMIAPFIISLQEVSACLPLLILGVLALFEGILILPLPETKGIILPDTIDDIESDTNDNLLNNNDDNNGNYIAHNPLNKESNNAA